MNEHFNELDVCMRTVSGKQIRGFSKKKRESREIGMLEKVEKAFGRVNHYIGKGSFNPASSDDPECLLRCHHALFSS